ncbi:MAG: hypothetical protein R2737_07435 [Candidatus Nanopelagicales bacterium]
MSDGRREDGRLYSPDGKHWWDGTAWHPVTVPPEPDSTAKPIRESRSTGLLIGAVIVVGAVVVAAVWGMLAVMRSSPVAGSSAPDSTANDYPATQAGLDKAISDCAREVITLDQFVSTADVMEAATAIDNVLVFTADCVESKNTEFVCAPADTGTGIAGTPVCAFKRSSNYGTMLLRTDAVDQALRDAGAPGY